MESRFTRRSFLARQSAVVGRMALAGLLPDSLLLADDNNATTGVGDITFPLKASENRRYLVDSRGKPFFLLGDTPWFLQKLKLEDVRLILDDRKSKGFNTLFLEILDDSAMPSRDAYGNVAFEPEKDITRPVEAYWRYADTVMEEVTRQGFFVIMSDLWYGAGNGLWMHHVTPESARTYGHFLGRRYARFKNLMWMHCGDRNADERLAKCANELAIAIKQEAPHHLHTAHMEHEFSSADFFNKEPWLDVNMAYTYGASYLQVSKEYQRNDRIRPVILGETGYEAEPNAIELLPDAKRGRPLESISHPAQRVLGDSLRRLRLLCWHAVVALRAELAGGLERCLGPTGPAHPAIDGGVCLVAADPGHEARIGDRWPWPVEAGEFCGRLAHGRGHGCDCVCTDRRDDPSGHGSPSRACHRHMVRPDERTIQVRRRLSVSQRRQA